MGGKYSKNIEYTSTVFNGNQNELLELLFLKISGDGNVSFTSKELKEFLKPWLPEDVAVMLFAYMNIMNNLHSDRQNKKKQNSGNRIDSPVTQVQVTRTGFRISMEHALKGSIEERATLLTHLSDNGKMLALKTLLSLLLHLAELSLHPTSKFMSWKFISTFSCDQFIRQLMCNIMVKGEKHKCNYAEHLNANDTFDVDDAKEWLKKTPLVLEIMSLGFFQCFPIGDVSQFSQVLPMCNLATSYTRPSTILDLPSVIFINSILPQKLQTEWRLLFSSAKHGTSFSMMLKRILNEGPTIVLIKDEGDHVFGGFAAESWSMNGRFYGSSHCFLFSLFPEMDYYLPSGYNTNFMYLNQNQMTLPNGLGMGGQYGYAGLWIDQKYGTGHSKAQPRCTTYNSPQLSCRPEFSFDLMEVWGVELESLDENSEEHPDRSSLKKSGVMHIDAETKAMMELMGRQQNSDGFAETELEDN